MRCLPTLTHFQQECFGFIAVCERSVLKNYLVETKYFSRFLFQMSPEKYMKPESELLKAKWFGEIMALAEWTYGHLSTYVQTSQSGNCKYSAADFIGTRS